METILGLLLFGAMVFVWYNRLTRKYRRLKRNYRRAGRFITQGTTQPAGKYPSPEGFYLPSIPASLTIIGKAYIIDGDTIKIGKTKIRLAGIDAPEIDMPYGQKSKWEMVGICKGQVITARLDGERSYDRLVATCYLPDGRDIGAEIIKRGLALDLPHFSGGKYRHLEPDGAREKLCNGMFGHSSIRSKQFAQAYRRNNR